MAKNCRLPGGGGGGGEGECVCGYTWGKNEVLRSGQRGEVFSSTTSHQLFRWQNKYIFFTFNKQHFKTNFY